MWRRMWAGGGEGVSSDARVDRDMIELMLDGRRHCR